MQGASVRQTRSVCSERARAAAADRSRCVFAKQIRGFSAQCLNPKEMCCRWHFCQLCPPPHQRIPQTAENRTLCRARALSKREAFVASGRGRRQAAEAGADLRSKYADSPRKASAQNRCDVYRISAGHAPHQRNPKPAENRTLCRARALGKRRGSAGWDTLSQRSSNGKCVPDYRLRMGCIFRMDCWRKVHPGIRAQNGTRFPNGGPSGKRIPEPRLKLGRAFRSISSTPKPMRPPFQNWVEESQNAIAGGQYDCRR